MTVFTAEPLREPQKVKQLESALTGAYKPMVSTDKRTYEGRAFAIGIMGVLEAVGQEKLLEQLQVLPTSDKRAVLNVKKVGPHADTSNVNLVSERQGAEISTKLMITTTRPDSAVESVVVHLLQATEGGENKTTGFKMYLQTGKTEGMDAHFVAVAYDTKDRTFVTTASVRGNEVELPESLSVLNTLTLENAQEVFGKIISPLLGVPSL